MALPRILNPREIPVAGTDAHLPPLPGERLTAPALRHRFGQPRPGWQPELPGDGRVLIDRVPAQAAVLVPLVERDDGLRVLLTRRTEHLRDHAGQISFPGGRSEPHDDGAPATALREAEEEVGLPRRQVEVIGQLPAYTTITRYVVTPVIALVRPPLELSQLPLDHHEVAAAYEVPLAFLMNPAHHRRHVFTWDGGQRQFLSMPWRREGAGDDDEVYIWGATAAMLRNLYRFLGD